MEGSCCSREMYFFILLFLCDALLSSGWQHGMLRHPPLSWVPLAPPVTAHTRSPSAHTHTLPISTPVANNLSLSFPLSLSLSLSLAHTHTHSLSLAHTHKLRVTSHARDRQSAVVVTGRVGCGGAGWAGGREAEKGRATESWGVREGCVCEREREREREREAGPDVGSRQ